jgi:hypothetical protein
MFMLRARGIALRGMGEKLCASILSAASVCGK